MAITLSKSQEELQNMPLVDLAYEILRLTKEPIYFRDLMKEVQELRGMTEEEAMKVIARLYTELNIDGRFLCLGQNVWGLKRWYPVDRTQEKSLTSKRFIRKSGDAFSDDEDEDSDDYDSEDEDEDLSAALAGDDSDDDLADDDEVPDEDDEEYLEDEDEDEDDGFDEADIDEEPLDDEEDSENEDEDDYE